MMLCINVARTDIAQILQGPIFRKNQLTYYVHKAWSSKGKWEVYIKYKEMASTVR